MMHDYKRYKEVNRAELVSIQIGMVYGDPAVTVGKTSFSATL
jgi:hypothetical protein